MLRFFIGLGLCVTGAIFTYWTAYVLVIVYGNVRHAPERGGMTTFWAGMVCLLCALIAYHSFRAWWWAWPGLSRLVTP